MKYLERIQDRSASQIGSRDFVQRIGRQISGNAPARAKKVHAHAAPLRRDYERLEQARTEAGALTLGSGAIAGEPARAGEVFLLPAGETAAIAGDITILRTHP